MIYVHKSGCKGTNFFLNIQTFFPFSFPLSFFIATFAYKTYDAMSTSPNTNSPNMHASPDAALNASSSYRPRNAGHNYYGRGTYLITLVVRGRERLLSRFVSDIGHENNGAPGSAPVSAATIRTARGCERLELTPLGASIMQQWQATPALQAAQGNRVAVHAAVCMPDHFHGVIEVLEPMEWSLGDIMQAFKAACTSRWQQAMGLPSSVNRPVPADCRSEKAPEWLRLKAGMYSDEGSLVRSLSKRRRLDYYAFVNRRQCPLFDDNYDDTVCLDERHRQAMIAYVNDNPRRAMLRRMLPDVMRRCLHVRIGERSYGAFGNLFLLRWARKIQVMCHRRHPVTRQPYEQTDDYAAERCQWLTAILEGCTVM